MRKLLALLILCTIGIAIAAIFWYNDYIYSLPTPVPAGYLHIKNGEHIALKPQLQFNNGKPLFLHFFNPDCPCSRFNITHFKSLVERYGNQSNFVVVVMTSKNYTPAQIKERFHLNVPVISDAALAAACGVYSTPQAVILTTGNNLYYRGNYNSSRYCTDERTAYAQMALTALLTDSRLVRFNRLATTAYGCSLPNCTK